MVRSTMLPIQSSSQEELFGIMEGIVNSDNRESLALRRDGVKVSDIKCSQIFSREAGGLD